MGFVLEHNTIGFTGCMTQLILSVYLITECCVMTAMVYSRYVSIYRPLLYTVVMSPRVCSLLMLAEHLMGVSSAIIHTGCIIQLMFCGFKLINYYMCDTYQSLSPPVVAVMPMNLWVLFLWLLLLYLTSLLYHHMLWIFSMLSICHHLRVGLKLWAHMVLTL